jgi:signal transduction histidine kinase
VLLMAVALIPAGILAYLQYRSLAQVEEQTRQAFLGNLTQALVGVRVESENDFAQWLRTALAGAENHDWLAQRDLPRIQELSEIARKSCPHLTLFFACRLPAGAVPEVFVFRPGPDRRMRGNESDAAAQNVPSLVAPVPPPPAPSFHTAYAVLDGDRHQVFLHRVDLNGKVIGYYGFGIPTRLLAQDYFPALLQKHLARLASTGAQTLGSGPVAAVFDETGKAVCSLPNSGGAAFEVREQLDRQNGVLPGWTIRAGFNGDALVRHARADFLRRIAMTLVIFAIMLVAIVYIGVTAAREMRLSRAKSEFVASVSHELKTPLALIRGFAETLHLNRLGSPKDREEYFQIIENEILKLSMMIDRILEFSKIEVGLKRYHPEPADVTHLVEESLTHFSYELERSGFRLERRFEEPPPRAPVDPQGFSLALLNLVSNAIKYSDQDRHIGVAVARSNGFVEVSVSDHGIGIPRGEQDRIFEKFYRIGSGPVAKTKGAGLGLALVRHFAEAHGGAVRVASAPGQGSTFTISLPACDPP